MRSLGVPPNGGDPVAVLANWIRAVELHRATFERTWQAVIEHLTALGLTAGVAAALADAWLIQGDFLPLWRAAASVGGRKLSPENLYGHVRHLGFPHRGHCLSRHHRHCPAGAREGAAVLTRLARDLTAGKLSKNSNAREMEGTAGAEPWILESSDQLALVRRLEAAFPTLEEAGCTVGIGVATGADAAFIGPYHALELSPAASCPW